jgi:hypothetical protein
MKDFKRTKHNPTIGMTNEEVTQYWIEKSIEKYGDSFDYSLVGTISIKKDPCKIICKEHGILDTSFYHHLGSGKGCFKCGDKSCRDSKRMTFDEFLIKLDEIFPNKSFKVLSKDFKGRQIKHEKVYTQDEFDICKISVSTLLKGGLPNIKSAVFKNIYAKNKYNKKHNYSSLCFDNTIYNGAQKYTTVFCRKHGNYETKPNWILNGQGCGKCFEERRHTILRSNTKDFINKYIKRLGTDKSIYDKVNYTRAKEKVLIKCKIHNEYFPITPNDHLTGYGCPKCGVENGGYARTDYINQAKGRDSSLYLLECYKQNEVFYKIGITFQGIKARFSGNSSIPYDYKIINEHICDAGCAWDLEKELHKKYKSFQYFPKETFAGYTECFTTELPVQEIISYLDSI